MWPIFPIHFRGIFFHGWYKKLLRNLKNSILRLAVKTAKMSSLQIYLTIKYCILISFPCKSSIIFTKLCCNQPWSTVINPFLLFLWHTKEGKIILLFQFVWSSDLERSPNNSCPIPRWESLQWHINWTQAKLRTDVFYWKAL